MTEEPQKVVLGEVGGVDCSVVMTDRPWELPADVLVLSVSPMGLGQLGQAVQRAVPGIPWDSVSRTAVTAEAPQVVPVGRYVAGEGLALQNLVLASARETETAQSSASPGREPRGTPESAARATAAALITAADIDAEVVAMPLLGAGVVGLPLLDVAQANTTAAYRTLEALGGTSIRQLIFVCLDEQTSNAIGSAWRSLRPAATADTEPTPASETPREEPGAPEPEPASPFRELSPGARDVLSFATAVVDRGLYAPQVVDAPLVLVSAFVRRNSPGPGDPGGVAKRLVQILADGQEESSFVGRLVSGLGLSLERVFGLSTFPDDIAPSAEPFVVRARQLPAQLGQPPLTHVRHVLAAVVTTDPPLPPAVLDAVGVSADDLRLRLRQAIGDVVPTESPGVWDDILGVVTEATELAGGVSRDLVDAERGIPLEDDHLGVARYVTMLAAVIARRDTPLPLSVGLFGEWGAGKSYFMGMLREQVRALGASGDPGYLPEIEQITFNAWHYADTSLWASLGNEIFEQLAGPRPTADERREAIRAELKGKLQRASQLRAANAEAEQETARLRQDIDRAWSAKADSTLALLHSVAASPTVTHSLPRVWKQLGIEEPAEQGELLAAELRGARADVSSLQLALAGRRGLVAGVVTMLALLALAAAALVPTQWTQWLTRGGLAGLAALLAALTATLTRVRAGLNSLAKVAAEARAGAEKRADAAVADDLDRLRQADAHEAVVRAQLDEVLQRVGELGRELASLSPGQRLYGFVSERATSQDYLRELGLVSTIRRDFEHLIELMHDWRTTPDDDARKRPIDRIVLYIDDLDRCSPPQVVDVLQAVHLLLALDLFVVVVGVDPRWLLHSLRERYEVAFGNLPDADDDDLETWRTTPQDYLEKIFNIPFVLPGMTTESFEALIRKLSATPAGGGRVVPPAPTPVDRLVVPSPRPPSDGDGAPDAESRPSDTGGTADVPIQPGSEIAAIHGGGVPRLPRGLQEPELTLLAKLGPLVRSPREAKRLLNLYRMIRSTRDLSPAAEFLGTGAAPGEFQAVGVLLGLLTAYPRLLGRLLTAPPSDGCPGGLAHRDPHQKWADVVAGLKPHEGKNGWANDVDPSLTDEERREWDELVRRVEAATASVQLPDLTSFQRWGPRVARFSFLMSPLAAGEQRVPV